MKKTIIYILITVIIYYFLSIFFSKNSQFVQYFFSHSDSKMESIKKEIFLTDKLNILFIGDSSGFVKRNFDIWLDKSIITKQYGFLPIRLNSENKEIYSLNITLKKNISNILKEKVFYRIMDNEYNTYTIRTLNFKKGERIKVDFFLDKSLISKSEIIIPQNNVSN
ncbi:hypothetical protein Flavo103_44490 [Flavobacterium collinsii]|uniref:hypothetical protein n=1 Tax=Flavobacterium collinsii TaxID=1114861 RepID=UPI0022CB6E39|nr:hypothetical protein [Flavobacterium collinsii]GIQ61314.1 hypothetical protein Flavo103_44490 [Flavobacterium collinsii]